MSNYTATVLFFSSLCQTQLNQPLSMLDAANDGLGATLAVMYAVSAVVSAYFFAMWKRADADVKSRVWRRYGWFSALAFFGSCAGLATAVGDNQFRYIFHRIVDFLGLDEDHSCRDFGSKIYDPQWIKAVLGCYKEKASDIAQAQYRLSVSPVPYAIEFLCICCANLLVVERMVDFVGQGQLLGGRWLSLSARFAMVSVTALNVTNVVFMAVYSRFSVKGSSSLNQLVVKFENPNIQELATQFAPCLIDFSSPSCIATPFTNSAVDALQQGIKFAGYGSICEGCSLCIMLVSFVVAGVLCTRRFYSWYSGAKNKSSEAGRAVIQVRLRIIVTVSTVFLTFLIRAVYETQSRWQYPGANNVAMLCKPCQGLGPLVQIWLNLCPAFPFTVFLLSSPVTILVALWGMMMHSSLPSLGWKWGFQKKETVGDGYELKSTTKAGGEP